MRKFVIIPRQPLLEWSKRDI